MLGIAAALAASLAVQAPAVTEPGPATDPLDPSPAPIAVRFEHQVRSSSVLSLAAAGLAPADRPAEPQAAADDDWNHPFSSHWNLQDTTRRKRGRAVSVSEGYATRLKIHQIGAVVMLPLVATEFILGQNMINSTDRSSGTRRAHKAVALGIGAVFGVNTITGALNWWETRKSPEGRTRRTLHALMMLASDAGFLWTAMAASAAKRDLDGARHHRTLAEASISLSVASTVMMWLWKD